MHLHVLWIGKTKTAAAQAWSADYQRRIGRWARLETTELNERQGEAAVVRRAAGGRLWLLDPAGECCDSPGLARRLERAFAQQDRTLCFGLGPADGFTPAAIAAASDRLSLSPMIYSHELARVMLFEQLYRALAMLHHHPYPR
jgi:23S rRNA (pseudouridine1915-N3)-methyltransferase